MSNIQDARKKLGFTQLEVAKRVGVSYVTYRMWEQGISSPNPDNNKKLIAVLKLSASKAGEASAESE